MLGVRKRWLGCLVGLVALACPVSAGTIEWVPPGLDIGDTYHLAFLTSTTHQAISTDISVYDAIVDGLGDAIADNPYGDVNWLCIGSTASVDARDRVNISGPVFRLDGLLVASDATDIWDGTIQNPLYIMDTGVPKHGGVWTGTNTSGRKANHPLGGSAARIGNAQVTHGSWIDLEERVTSGDFRLYGISEPLTAVPEPSSLLVMLTGLAVGGVAARVRRRRQRTEE